MSFRRSARLQNQETQEPVEVQQPTPVEIVRNNKNRKTLAAYAEGTTGSKKKALNSAIGKGNKPPSQAQFGSANDTLSSLSLEILYMILDNVSR
jgi:hypothetical protein